MFRDPLNIQIIVRIICVSIFGYNRGCFVKYVSMIKYIEV